MMAEFVFTSRQLVQMLSNLSGNTAAEPGPSSSTSSSTPDPLMGTNGPAREGNQ